jgi:hypothetical protein
MFIAVIQDELLTRVYNKVYIILKKQETSGQAKQNNPPPTACPSNTVTHPQHLHFSTILLINIKSGSGDSHSVPSLLASSAIALRTDDPKLPAPPKALTDKNKNENRMAKAPPAPSNANTKFLFEKPQLINESWTITFWSASQQFKNSLYVIVMLLPLSELAKIFNALASLIFNPMFSKSTRNSEKSNILSPLTSANLKATLGVTGGIFLLLLLVLKLFLSCFTK